MYFRKLRGGSSKFNATPGRRLVFASKDSTARWKRQRRNRGFNVSRTWPNLNESQSDLTHDAAVELGNGKSTQTFVHRGEPQDNLAEGIHFSTSLRQHAEVRDLEAMQAAHVREGVV